MPQADTEFHSPDDEQIYHIGYCESDFVDLEQVDQFQPEVQPRSTTSASTDLYTSAQLESRRHREQGDPNEYDSRFEDQ